MGIRNNDGSRDLVLVAPTGALSFFDAILKYGLAF